MLARLVSHRPRALALLLTLALVYPYLTSLAVWTGLVAPATSASPLRIGAAIIVQLSLLALLDAVLRRQGRGWRDIGVTFQWVDLLHAAALFLGSYLVYVLVSVLAGVVAEWVTGTARPIEPSNVAFLGQGNLVMLLIFACTNPWFEELLIRAYPMTEWREYGLPEGRAIALSVVLQTGYHLYQGVPSMLLLSSTFFIFALYFARTGRALPIVLAHLAADVVAVLASRP